VTIVERGQPIMTLSSGFERTNSSGEKLSVVDGGHSIKARPDSAGECAGKHDGEPAIVVIDGRALERECLAHGLRLHYAGAAVSTFASVAELPRAREDHPIISAILLSIGGLAITDDSVAAAIKQRKSEFAAVPFIILAESEDLVQIVAAVESGARGHVPTTVGISVTAGR
jgi:hypothetical protein